MRVIDSNTIIEAVSKNVSDINFFIAPDILSFLKNTKTANQEKDFLNILIENSEIADSKRIALCQDTGIVIVFAKIGTEITLERDLQSLLDEAIRKGYQDNYLRKSVVSDPLERKNTGDNAPVVLHVEIVSGDVFELWIMAKGGGSENASALWMLDPADGEQGIVDKIVSRIKEKGANCCPPLLLGIGVGGDMEECALLAKKSLFRKIGERNPIQRYSDLEKKILDEVNSLGIGVGGFGGKITAMDVFIESAPCHIASMPVALNVGCHSTRHCVVRL
jgi:fumarate hydratase subunit alpha